MPIHTKILHNPARSCNNEPASKDILSAAVDSEFSWVGKNHQLISSAVQVNQSQHNVVLNFQYTVTAAPPYQKILQTTKLIRCGYVVPENVLLVNVLLTSTECV